MSVRGSGRVYTLLSGEMRMLWMEAGSARSTLAGKFSADQQACGLNEGLSADSAFQSAGLGFLACAEGGQCWHGVYLGVHREERIRSRLYAQRNCLMIGRQFSKIVYSRFEGGGKERGTHQFQMSIYWAIFAART